MEKNFINDHQTEVVYTASSKMKSPKKLAKEMKQDLKSSGPLSWALFLKDIKGDYAQSAFGMLWDFLEPLVISLIFVFLFKSQILSIGELNMPYPVFIVHGMLLWQTFMESLMMTLRMLPSSKAMVTHLRVPKEAFIIATSLRVLFNSLFRIVVILLCNLYFSVPIGVNFLYLIILFPSIMLLGQSIGLFLVPMSILYNDVNKIVNIVTRVMFYASPVIYPLPRAFPFNLILFINPMAVVINGIREASVLGSMINPIGFIVVLCLSAILLFVSWVNYYVTMPILVEKI